MAGLTASGRNAAVDGLAAVAVFVGLLDASGTEVTGGSPAYARKAVTYAAAASGIRASNVACLFDVPAVTVAFHGLYSAVTAGTNYAILPVQGATSSLPQAATFLSSTDTFTSYAHGLANGDRVIVSAVGTSGAIPAAYSASVVYFVVASATNTFQLSLTAGGAAVDGATDTELFVTKVVPEVFAAQGQYNIASGALTLDANLI